MTDKILNIPQQTAGQDLDIADTPTDRSPITPPPPHVQLDFHSSLTLDDAPAQEQPADSLENKGRSLGKTAIALIAVLLIGGLGFVGIRNISSKSAPGKEKTERRQKITPVLIATATQKTVPIQIKAIGTVQPGVTVSITPQVSGRINGVFFQKGQEIKKGQLLFTLDEQTQNASIQQAQGVVIKGQAAVQQAQATLDKDIGQIAQAEATLARDLQVVEQAKATLAIGIGQIAQARANLEKDQGLVKQAQAVLAKDIAQSKFAQAQNQRYSSLFKQGAISQDQAQQYLANSQVTTANIQADMEAVRNAEAVVRSDRIGIQNAEATVRGDQAAIRNAEAVVQGDRVAIENAKAVVRGDQAAIRNARAGTSSDQGALKNAQVQLAYTKIYAPIAGRAGNVLVQAGNVVQPSSSNPLVTIVQVNPIQVSFAVPATNLGEIQRRMSNDKLPVSIQLSATDKQPISGFLSFVNNTVDNTTGTIQLIGDFDNSDGKLWPGQYVNATLTLSENINATVVPAQAVQNGPNGQFVFVVKPDMTVDNVPVVASSTVDGLNTIKKGLKPGDKVVIDGQANLVSGGQIQLKTATDQQGDAGDQPRRRSGKRRSAEGGSPAGAAP